MNLRVVSSEAGFVFVIFCTILCPYVSEFILFYSYLLIILFISTVVIVFDNTSVLLPWKHISPFVGQ